MGIVDRLDNKSKHLKSRRSEVVQVDQMRKTIEEENEAVRQQIQLIGQYFWNLYKSGKYKPGETDEPFFSAIDKSELNIKLMLQQIEDRKITGIQERESIDEDTKAHIAEKQRLDEEKRQQKAQAAEERRLQKAEESEKKRQQRQENAEKKRQQKARAAEEKRLAAENGKDDGSE